MQEIKLFGRYMIRPDNGKTWSVSDILTNKDDCISFVYNLIKK